MIVFILPFAIIGCVFGNYDAYYQKSLSFWSHGVNDDHQGDNWWYDLGGHNSYASEYLYATSPYYSWFKNAQQQYDMFAPALHVGKINRGNFLNPALIQPADRAFGDPYHSDFHADEIRSGAFEYRPRGQKIVARKVSILLISIAVILLVKVDVDAGIAKHVGDIIRLPLPVFVKKDGTLLVSAPQENRANPHDACSIHPNPCSIFQVKTKCHHFDDHLAECSGKIYAVVELHEAQGSGVTGTLIVEQVQGKIRIVGTVHGLEPGTHGFHVHEYGSIGNDCMDAGGHFNPYNVGGPLYKFWLYSFYS